MALLKEKMKLKTNTTIFFIVLLCTILHFIITTLVGNYMSTQIGSLSGRVVAKGLIEASGEISSSGKNVNEIYRDMVAKNNDELSKWKIQSLLISLPIKPVLNPLIQKIRIAWIDEQVRSNKISFDQVKNRGRIIENIANCVNSISFGILIYFAYSLMVKVRSR